MRTRFTLRKIISYLLMFTMLLGGLEAANFKEAKAAQTAEKTFAEQITLKTDLDSNVPLIVDSVSGRLTYEKINLATRSFTIEGNTGYKVTNVTYPSSSLTETKGTSSNNTPKYQYAITEYSNFQFVITVESTTDATIKQTYTIDMKYDVDALFQFDTIDIVYSNAEGKKTPASISYTEKDSEGYYRKDAPQDTVTAKVNLISGSYVMTEGVLINGQGPGTEITLTGGDNYIPITITRNNSTMKYDLVISKKGEALLKSLEPSAGSLSPAFDTNTFDYTLDVPETQTSIAFTPTSVDNASTIKVGKYVVKSGKKSSEFTLAEGTNKISIAITTKEGESATYVVRVTRAAKFRSANLSGITLSSGTLNPAFNKEVYTYTASVENSVSSINITPTAEDPASIIKVNDVKLPSGATSGAISLDEGGNLVTVTVTDTKGNTNTYTLSITRKYSKDNVNLASLTVTDGTFSPKFDPETYAYSVKVARNIERVKVGYKSQNEDAEVTINGKKYENAQQSDYIKLDLGANMVVVQITAEDGKSTTTYKLSIIRGEIEGTNKWVLIAGEWHFYDAAGVEAKNEWVKYDNQWYYVDFNGYRKTGWLAESGKWYYLNKDGIMQTGWFYDNGYWYYLQGDGAMRVNGWVTYDAKWYYFNGYGQLQTGWLLYKGKYYFMDDRGVMQKGWVTWDKNKYYLNDDGSLKYGWLYTGKTWYYLGEGGRMARGWQVINGKRYYFDTNGLMKTGMMFLDGQWINLNNA